MRRSTIALLLVLTALPCAASERADDLIREALHREIYCLSEERSALLDAALKAEPKSQAAQWHLGRVWHQGQWIDAEQMPEQQQSLRVMQRYETRRSEAADTVAGQLELAQWCGQQKLWQQRRAHLSRVIALSPDHPVARQALGFIRAGNQWVPQAELVSAVKQAEIERQMLNKHADVCRKLAEQLAGEAPKVRAHAEQRLREEATSEWIPALEVLVAPTSELAGQAVVETIAAMPQQRATDALLQIGLSSRWPNVREAAASRLNSRNRDQYVPQLLAALQTPATGRVQVTALPNGRLVSRMVVQRENMNEQQVAVSDTFYRRINLGGSARAARGEAAERIGEDAWMAARAVAGNNLRTLWTNRQVMALLAAATGEEPGATPQDWWDWWNESNEVFVASKAVRTAYNAEEEVIVDDLPITGGGNSVSGGAMRSPRRSDCLVAGTQVWTASGPRAVEQIQVGDLVLSQSPHTGELAYKPVLGTTVRPSGPLMHVSVGKDEISCSGGHLFWVSGEGWVKSRLLESGMPVHTPKGVMQVKEVRPQDAAETYNLVVADFHTYFVGDSRLLCHDNTVREPTESLVPGLAPQ